MYAMQANAIHTSKRHTRLKYLSVILLLVFCFSIPVFADWDVVTKLSDRLQDLISILSWAWIVVAALAGKMMTNDRVFGAALHMDIYLRKIWNIMKNFANFALIAFLLGSLIKNLIKGGDMDIKGLITKTLIAGVLIQASWFMVGALVDISTVAVSAVGSFPSSFMWSNTEFQTRMDTEMRKISTVKYKVDMATTKAERIADPNASTNTDDMLASIMPDSNSLWWPLIFLGMSTFRFYQYLSVDGNNTEALALGFSLKSVVLIMFTVWLLLLLIANIIRVAFLWIFIITSPFLVLFKVFSEDKVPGEGSSTWLAKYLSVKSLIDMVFKPVIFMAMLSLILILVISMQNIMLSQSSISLNGVNMSVDPVTSSSTLSVQNVSSVTFNDNLFKDISSDSKSVFADLILFFLTIFLMWELIKWSVTFGEWPIQDVMKPVTEFIENFAKSTPLVGWFGVTAMQKGFKDSRKAMAESQGMRTDGSFYKWEDELKRKVNTLLHLQNPRTRDDYRELTKIAKSGGDFFGQSQAKAKANEWWLRIADPERRSALDEWLRINWSKTLTTANKRGTNYVDSDGIDKFLGKDDKTNNSDLKKNRKMFHELMGGWKAIRGKEGTPPATDISYEDLMKLTYWDTDKAPTP